MGRLYIKREILWHFIATQACYYRFDSRTTKVDIATSVRSLLQTGPESCFRKNVNMFMSTIELPRSIAKIFGFFLLLHSPVCWLAWLSSIPSLCLVVLLSSSLSLLSSVICSTLFARNESWVGQNLFLTFYHVIACFLYDWSYVLSC